MKYMLLICRNEAVWDTMSSNERQQIYEETRALSEELTARGQYLGGSPLYPSSSATSVRVRDGKRLVTDGPFAETREQLGGYMLIDVKDLERSHRHRRTHPAGPHGHRGDPPGARRPTDVRRTR